MRLEDDGSFRLNLTKTLDKLACDGLEAVCVCVCQGL